MRNCFYLTIVASCLLLFGCGERAPLRPSTTAPSSAGGDPTQPPGTNKPTDSTAGTKTRPEIGEPLPVLVDTTGADGRGPFTEADDILTAIQRDDLARVKAILNKSPDLADNFQGRSPLRNAASLGRLEICRFLIREHHVDVNDVERGAGFPIIKEALAFPQVVRLLIESGADLKTRITPYYGTGVWIINVEATALHYAASDGVPETVTLLIDSGVDVFAVAQDKHYEDSKQTALEVAACFGKADNAEAIIRHPKFVAADRQLRQALLNKCLHVGAFPSALAQGAQRAKLLKVLVENGADPNFATNGVTAMQIAANEIHPTHEKENAQIKQLIAVLTEHGAKVDLFSAVAIGDVEQVRRLLKLDPKSADSRGPDGYPALHFAVGMDYKDIIAALLEAGCDVNIRSKSKTTGHLGETALHSAAFWGRYEIAKQLIDAKADVNARSDRKSTPLHDAARMANVKLTQLLLENGATPDARDRDGTTPLDWCRELNAKNADEIEKIFSRLRVNKER
jgi:ankyrin repeat protein